MQMEWNHYFFKKQQNIILEIDVQVSVRRWNKLVQIMSDSLVNTFEKFTSIFLFEKDTIQMKQRGFILWKCQIYQEVYQWNKVSIAWKSSFYVIKSLETILCIVKPRSNSLNLMSKLSTKIPFRFISAFYIRVHHLLRS